MRNGFVKSIICMVVVICLSAAAVANSSDFVTEPAKRVPVIYDVDVVVAGGGISGVFAALAAAREGARTVLIDKFGTVGGNIGPGMNSPEVALMDWSKVWKKGAPQEHVRGHLTGLPKEYAQRFFALKPGKAKRFLADSNIGSYLALKMLMEAGVELMLSTYVTDPIIEGGKVRGVFVENKSGRQAVKAKVVIDATGEADVARRAGASVLYPKESYHELDNHAPTGMGIWALVAGIDPNKYDPGKSRECHETKDIGGLAEVRCWDGVLHGYVDTDKTLAGLLAQLVRPHAKVDAGNGQHISMLEAGVRMYIFEAVQRFREKVPGCENAHLLFIAPFLGSRGGPCIDGAYTLTMDDCRAGKQFDDVIYIYGQVNALRYNCKQGQCKLTDVPYRVMIPEKLDGLMAVGRSASCIPDTLLRVREAVMYMGQAGGTAAAMAAKNRINPRDIDIKKLQNKLLAAGFHLGDEDRLKKLNLNVTSKNIK